MYSSLQLSKKLSSGSNSNGDIRLPAETSEGHNTFSKLLEWKILMMTTEITFIITIELQ